MAKAWQISFTVTILVILAYRLSAPQDWPDFDLTEIGLVFLIFIPYLARTFSELSVGGLFSAKLRDLQEKVADVSKEQAALDDRVLLDVPLIGSAPIRKSEIEVQARETSQVDVELEELARLYVKTRREMTPSDRRTMHMESLMQSMIGEAERVGENWKNQRAWARSDNAGRQLAAIAYGIRFPNSVDVDDLMFVVKNTEQPFIQYWALRLVRLLVRDRGDSVLRESDWDFLKNLRNTLSKSTDRARLIASILDFRLRFSGD